MGSLMNQVFYTDTYDLSIVSLIVAVFAVAIVAWVVWELAQVILRHMIGKEYSVRVPFSVRVGLNRRHSPATCEPTISASSAYPPSYFSADGV
mgnify:CR=1 FL=1